MADKQTFQWFLRGFAVTAMLIIVAMFLVQPIWGQSGTRGNQEADTAVADSNNNLTDDPQGRLFVPLQDEEAPISNIEAHTEAVRAQAGASDSGETAVRANNAVNNGYSSPLVVPAADFRSDGDDPATTLLSFSGGYIAGTLSGSGCVIAPAYLPKDAVINTLQISAYDTDGSNQVAVSLRRVDNYSGAVTLLATASTSGSDASIVTPSVAVTANNTVAYPTYAYYLTTCLQTESLRLYAVSISYTQP